MTKEQNGVIPNILFPVIPRILFPVIPSVVEESRGNEFFLIPRDKGLLLFNFSSARIRLVPLFKHASAR